MRAAIVVCLFAAADARADECTIRGELVTLKRIAVRAGVEVDVQEVPAIATVRGRSTVIDVGGPIAFRGRLEHAVWYTVGRETVDGGVTLARGAHVIAQSARGADVIGRAVFYADDVLEGEIKDADESVSRVRVPCDHLRLDWVGGDDDGDDELDPALEGDGTHWRPRRGDSIVLRRAPSATAAGVTYRSDLCGSTCMTLVGFERRGAWRKVGARNEGVTVLGWVPTNALVAERDQLLGHSYGCHGDHERELSGFGRSLPRRQVRIRAGTRIYARPNADVWGSVQREDELFDVAYKDGDDWAEVVSMPNIRLRAGRAYVLVSSLIAAP